METTAQTSTIEETKTRLQNILGDQYILVFAHESCILIPCGRKVSKEIMTDEQIPCIKYNKFFNKHPEIIGKEIKKFEDSNNECECSYLFRKHPFVYFDSTKHSSSNICAIKIYCEKESDLNAIFNLFQKIYKENFGASIVKYSSKFRKLVIKKDSLDEGILEMKVL